VVYSLGGDTSLAVAYAERRKGPFNGSCQRRLLGSEEVSLQNSAPPPESRPSGTESRVKKHMGSIFIKLGVETRNAATLRDLEALSQSRTKSA